MLSVVGVQRSRVLDDYSLTQSRLSGKWANAMIAALQGAGIAIDNSIRGLLVLSPSTVMNDVLTHIEQKYHSVEGYLYEKGLQRDSVDMLKSGMIE